MKKCQCAGTIIHPGKLAGQVVWVRHQEDIQKVNPQSLVLLDGCSKSTAVLALQNCQAGINLLLSLTSHLNLALPDHLPFAMAPSLKEQSLHEGEWVEIEIIPITASSSTSAAKMVRFVPSLAVPDIPRIGAKAARLAKLKELGFCVPPWEVAEVETIRRFIARVPVAAIIGNRQPTDAIPSSLLAQLREAVIHAGQLHAVQQQSQPLTTQQANLSKPAFCGTLTGNLFAVRSSGVNEDGTSNAMAGAFHSELNVPREKLANAIAQVAASVFKDDLWLDKTIADLSLPQDLAVIIQEMVPKPLLAGAFFTHASDFDTLPILEARYCGYADTQMEGSQAADIVARSDAKANADSITLTHCPAHLDCETVKSWVLPLMQEALAVHRKTGWGDMEFVMDAQRQIHWVQARPLTHKIARIVELVVRRGFSSTAIEYYQKLAFYVCQANQIPSVAMQLFNLGDGQFGYDEGIRNRDRVFHQLIRQNPEHLQKVVAYGWKIEAHIAQLLAQADADPALLFDTMLLHSAVQLPFCIPSAVVKDRYNSHPVDTDSTEIWTTKNDLWLDQVVAHWLSLIALPNPLSTLEAIDLLRLPIQHNSTLRRWQEINHIAHLPHPTVDDCWPAAIFDLRDIPRLPQEPNRPVTDPGNIEDEHLREAVQDVQLAQKSIGAAIQPLAQKSIGAAIQPLESGEQTPSANVKLSPWETIQANHRQKIQQRNQLLHLLQNSLPAKEKHELDMIEPWLLLKGETNESHSFYRGSVFLKLARMYTQKGLDPRIAMPKDLK